MNAVNIFCSQAVIDAARSSTGYRSTWVALAGQWRSAWRRITRAYALHRQRRELLELDSRALKDIGISAADAWREGHLPFWVDSTWRTGE